MRCAACENPDGGYAHTCVGSGTYIAAEIHVAEQIAEISSDWPRFDVTIHCQIRAADKGMANDKLIPLVTALLEDDTVENSDFTITEQPA